MTWKVPNSSASSRLASQLHFNQHELNFQKFYLYFEKSYGFNQTLDDDTNNREKLKQMEKWTKRASQICLNEQRRLRGLKIGNWKKGIL